MSSGNQDTICRRGCCWTPLSVCAKGRGCSCHFGDSRKAPAPTPVHKCRREFCPECAW